MIFHIYSILRDKLPCKKCKKKSVEQNDTHRVERRHHHAPTLEQLPSVARFRDSILDDIEISGGQYYRYGIILGSSFTVSISEMKLKKF